MKKILFLILFCACASVAFAQETQYKRCLDGITRWSTLFVPIFSADIGILSANIVAYGDTIINNILYKKMWKEGIGWENNDLIFPPNSGYNCIPISFFIRENETASKLYIYDSFRNEEFLISNMDLQVGDSILLPDGWHCNMFPPKYHIVDSVYFKDELKHIEIDYPVRLSFGNEDKLTFIEGIGTNIGIDRFRLEQNCLFNSFEENVINCFKNQTFSYKNDNGYFCGYEEPRGGSNNVLDDNFNISVNNNIITILADENIEVSLYNISGIMLFNNKFTEQNITIPVSFPKGVYFVKIISNNKTYINKIVL